MMQTNILLSHPFTKINACIIGYGLWLILSNNQMITHTVQAPVCFYKVPAYTKITAPDNVEISIKASKKNFHHLDIDQIAIHIDLSQYTSGIHYIVLQKENLFLPDDIYLVNLSPSVIQVQLEKTE